MNTKLSSSKKGTTDTSSLTNIFENDKFILEINILTLQPTYSYSIHLSKWHGIDFNCDSNPLVIDLSRVTQDTSY